MSTSTVRRLDINSRQQAILDRVRERGYASIEALAEHFGVSQQTIRRDVIELAGRSLVERHHGGAGLPAGKDRLAYDSRRVRNAEAKRRIAETLARHMPDGASLFIDIGTTMEAVARALVIRKDLRIITNHIAVASILCEATDFEIILAGGMVRNRDRAVTGEATCEFLRNYRVEYGIFGIGAIDDEGHLLDYDYRDVHVSRTAMEISRRKFVALDYTKFGGDAMMQMAHIGEIDAVFTDAPPPPPLLKQMKAGKVELIVAADADGG